MTSHEVELREVLGQAGIRLDIAESRQNAWYIRLLLGFAAWLAALFMLPALGFLFLDAIRDEASMVWVAVLLCLATAIPCLRVRDGDFLPQLGSALSVAGLGLLVLAAPGGAFSDQQAWLAVAVLAGGMYVVGPVWNHRFLMASMLAMAWLMSGDALPDLAGWRWTGVSMAWLAALYWIGQGRQPHPRGQFLQPLAWVLALTSMLLAWWMPALDMFGGPTPDAVASSWRVVAPVFAAALLPVVSWLGIARAGKVKHGVTQGLRWGMVCVLLLLLPVWFVAPGMVLALNWLILGFGLIRPFLLGLGVVSLLTYLAAFYYQLDLTLLQKSGWLAVAGGALALCGLAIGRRRR